MLPPTTDQRMVVIDFMGYANKMPTKKMKLKTFGDLMTCLISKFKNLAETCTRVDIVFNLYHENSINAHERNRQCTKSGITTIVSHSDQPLPIDIDALWSLSQNNVSFQQFSIKWVLETQKNINNLYLGGAHEDDETSCIHLKHGSAEQETLLKCNLEEADDRIFFHVRKICSVPIAFPDTDILVCSLYHYHKLMPFDLNDFWAISEINLVNLFGCDVVDILPAVHALTGCDTTSKVGTKSKALKTAISCGNLVQTFGKDEINDEMIVDAEQFLVKCVSSSKSHLHKCFDELRHEMYHAKKFTFDFEKLPPTNTSIKQHILRYVVKGAFRRKHCS